MFPFLYYYILFYKLFKADYNYSESWSLLFMNFDASWFLNAELFS